MPIRSRNLDLNVDSMKGRDNVSLGDVTATRAYQVFVAPVACRVDYVKVYSNEANPPAATTASTTNMSATVHAIINGTASVMVTRGTSATAITSNAIVSHVGWDLIPTANNNLSAGTPVRITFTIGGSGTLSAAIVQVGYTPLLHKETR